MTENVIKLKPSKNYVDAYAKYIDDSSLSNLSIAEISGIVIGVILGIVLIIVIILSIYYCRNRHPRYQSAYETEEAYGNKFTSAEHALQQKFINHPDVKAELYI